MGKVIRQGTLADVAAITALTRLAYAKRVPLVGREPLPMQADYSVAITRHRFDLMFVGSDLVGLIETLLRPDDLLIENVAVAPDFQRRGLGRTLMHTPKRWRPKLGGCVSGSTQTHASNGICVSMHL